MMTKVTKLGNSLTISIPQNLAKEMSISEGSEINISVVDGNLVVKPKNSLSKNRLATLGKDKGKFIVPEDFNDPLPEDILAAFEGN
jgi:antitoxin component of MazEF toxin-antitoxin module